MIWEVFRGLFRIVQIFYWVKDSFSLHHLLDLKSFQCDQIIYNAAQHVNTFKSDFHYRIESTKCKVSVRLI